MARPLPLLSTLLPIHIIPSFYTIFSVFIILSIFSLVTFLCASHNRQKEKAFLKKKLAISRKNLLESLSKANNISSKALLKMASWRKQVQNRDDEDNHGYYGINNDANEDYIVIDDDGFIREDAVWKKGIIRGEKCKPLEFSGKIDYDSEGNLLNDHDTSVGNDAKRVKISSKNDVVIPKFIAST